MARIVKVKAPAVVSLYSTTGSPDAADNNAKARARNRKKKMDKRTRSQGGMTSKSEQRTQQYPYGLGPGIPGEKSEEPRGGYNA